MNLISVFRYRSFDPAIGVALISPRMGTIASILGLSREVLFEDSIRVNNQDLDAEGWTEDGFWQRNAPPVYL